MKTIALNRLRLENFKGVRNFTLKPGGDDVAVYGNNGTGKTTLMDAFLWLLFNKDSQGKSEFEIKTLSGHGQYLSGLDHAVECELLIDGKTVTLRKVYKEKWTKKRGETSATLTGHTTDYAIDGVPVKKKEWDARLSEIINEDMFRLLTSPTYFASLPWQKRRELLLEVCGDVADKDVIASDEKLSSLPDILGDRGIDDHKKVVKSRQQAINKRLQEIPARIDELSRSLPDETRDPEEIRKRIATLEADLESARTDGGRAELERQIRQVDFERSQVEARGNQEREDRVRWVQAEIQSMELKRENLTSRIDDTGARITSLKLDIERVEDRMKHLRELYKDVFAEQPVTEDACPTCGQDIPEAQQQEAIEKFNAGKAERLAKINAEGKDLKAQVENHRSTLGQSQQLLASLQKQYDDLTDKIQGATKKEEAAKAARNDHDDTAEQLQNRLQDLRKKLEDTGNGQVDTSAIEEKLERERGILAGIEAAGKTKKRIEELGAEEKSLSKEYEQLESEMDTIDRFVVRKVELLEEKINNHFELARFKMFNQQINGGIEETCEVVYHGVPFHTGLNRGAQINVGLDIVRTLSEHYQTKCPVWVDNAEAITRLINPGTQTIKLVVSPDHDALDVRNVSEAA